MAIVTEVGARCAARPAVAVELPKFSNYGCTIVRKMSNGSREIPHPATDAIELTAVLRTCGEPIRLAMIRALAAHGEEMRARDVQGAVGLPTSTCSYHLKLLREAGVTRTRPAGTERWISLRRDDLDARFPGLVEVLLAG